MTDNQRILELLDRFEHGLATEAELAELDAWYNSFDRDERYTDGMTAAQENMVQQQLLERIRGGMQKVPHRRSATLRLWQRIGVAAAVAVVLFGAGLFFYNQGQKNTLQPAVYANDAAPGKQGATLTLAGGEKIRLTEAVNGELAKQAGIVITKSADGKLIYEIKGSDSAADQINTLSTARGETYQVRLPDGSSVWLNAASSITYSAALLDNGKRKVSLSGEAYFEVAKDSAHPFVVRTAGQEVEVLRTHFNINAYNDEPIVRTTLLEGSVNVSSGTEKKKLEPGFETIGTSSGLKVREADTRAAVAWMNERFRFDSQDIRTVMRAISRWYDVEVVYEGEPITDTFSGGMNRFDKLSKVLKSLESVGGVHFRIENKKVYVHQ